jgi:drug/metabolite transporter (DMT)-like permease
MRGLFVPPNPQDQMNEPAQIDCSSATARRTAAKEGPPAAVYGAMAFAVVAIAFSSIFITELERSGVKPGIVALYRMSLATAFLLPAAIKFRGREIAGLAPKDILLLVLAGLFLALHFLTWITSLQYIPIAASVVLVASHPLLVVVAARVFLGERPSRRNLAGIGIGLAGTAVICFDGFRSLANGLWGDILAILGAASLVGYLLIGRRTRARISLLAYATPVYAACSVFLLGWAVLHGDNLTSYSLESWGYFAALAVIPTILGHTVLNWAIKHVPASAISISLLGEPVVAAILALIIFAQRPSAYTVLGGGLVLLGICFATSGSVNMEGLDLD